MTRGIHWFRNDLRLQDNTALKDLASRTDGWLPVFILDPRIITDPSVGEPRTRFLIDCLGRLRRDLEKRGVPFIVRKGHPEKVLPKLLHETGARLLSFNEDVTPFARRRDAAVRQAVERSGGEVMERLDHVVFRSSEIRSASGGPYAVYSPYKRSWWKRYCVEPRLPNGPLRLPPPIPGFAAEGISDLGAASSVADGCEIPTGGTEAAKRRLDRFLGSAAGRYHLDRDRPDLDGSSRLSPYLRFGAISVRQCFARAEEAAHQLFEHGGLGR